MTNTVYRYLGWGITNENGVAKLDHDENGDAIEHSYTGVGAGEIDIVASTDNPIVEGSVQSEPYPLLDALFYDDGLTNHSSSNYSSVTALVEEAVTDGVQISKTASGSTNARYVCNTGSSEDIQAEVTIKTDGQVRFGFIDTNNAVSYANVNNSEFVTCAIKRTNNTITATIDGTSATLQTNNANTSDTLKFFLQIYNTSNTVTFVFKDVKIYPI